MEKKTGSRKAVQAAVLLGLAAVLTLGGCAKNDNGENAGGAAPSAISTAGVTASPAPTGTDMTGMTEPMEHSGTGEVPAGLQDAASPKFPVGSQAVMEADHMPGMKGALATIEGAYDTTAYAISYQPTTGGERVTNHKWIIQQEIENAGTEDYKPGTEITVLADHMPGMKGTKAVVDSFKHTVVYMVGYTPTDGGKPVTGHKWVTEDELSAP